MLNIELTSISQAMTYLMLRSQLAQQQQITRQQKNFFSIRGPAFVPTHNRINHNNNNSNRRMQQQVMQRRNHHRRHHHRMHRRRMIRVWPLQMTRTKTIQENHQKQITATMQTAQMVLPNRQENRKKIRITQATVHHTNVGVQRHRQNHRTVEQLRLPLPSATVVPQLHLYCVI